MSNRNAVQQAFDRFGKAAGFEKKSGSWYCRGEEVIAVSNLQKSQYGPRYYLNQAFCIRGLVEDPFPKPNKSHIRGRAESLVGDKSGHRLEQLLDLDWTMPDEERIDELTALLRERLLPIIERGSTIDGLRALHDEGALTALGLSGEAQTVLGGAQH